MTKEHWELVLQKGCYPQPHGLGDALSLEHSIELVLGGDLRHLRYLRGGAGLGLRSAV